MSETCIEEQISALEGIFDWIDLDNVQQSVIDAVGDYWAGGINSAIAALEFEAYETLRDMRKEVEHD